MLVLSRKRGECIMLSVPGLPAPIKIAVVEFRSDKVRLGIDAPTTIGINREEIYHKKIEQKENYNE